MEVTIDTRCYLQRIGYPGDLPEVSVETLCKLHRLHLFNVPFENLDIHLGRPITLDIDRIFDKIAFSRRGGFCYELNNLFHHLLTGLGFPVYFIACTVYRPERGNYDPDFGHVANVVTIDGERWLADVGFGDGFIRPLRLEFDVPQEQRGRTYKLEKREDGIRLLKAPGGQDYVCMYKLSLKPRKIGEFREMCIFHQTSPRSLFTQKKFCTLPNAEGRITLTHNALITTRKGVKESRKLSGEAEFEKLLEDIFGIRL